MAKLGECFSVIRNGASIRQTDGAGGFPITRIETIADKTINREKFGYAGIYDLAQYRDYILQDGDILMSHINSEKHLGKVALYSKRDDEQIIHGMNLLMLRADTQKVIPEYAKYYFESQKFLRQIGRITKKSVNQASFTVTALKELEIPLASIIVQRDISEKLKKVDWLVSLRKQQLAKLDELVKARFVEMFGDVLLNSMQWPEKTLENMADIVSGITKGRKTAEADLQEVPYMAVSNVKDGYIDWTTVKTILATRQEIEQYRLMPDDILMTEGGDPDKVGRGAIIKVPLKNSIHQNHIFRVRLDEQEILPSFFAEYLRHQKAKRYFLGCAKQTTGIASINMRQLRALPTLVPPLSLQKQFAAFVERVDQQKQTVQQGLEKLELMKKALMQEYFG